MTAYWKYVVLGIALLAFIGCANTPMTVSQAPETKKVREPEFPYIEPPQVAEGSLWSENRGLSLYPDRRASKVGDLVVVRIEENPEATLNANTNTSRTSSIAAKLKFLGFMESLAQSNPNLAQNPGEDDLIKAALNSGFDGEGSSTRDGNVKAYISAVVTKVFPNGNLYINGKREIMVNNETQYIIIAGIIRPQDINTTNEISSTYVADARIMYSGVGAVADKQRPGWLGRIVDYVWPF